MSYEGRFTQRLLLLEIKHFKRKEAFKQCHGKVAYSVTN